jgi:hypothetical protein
MVQAFARFMIVFFIVVGAVSQIRPLTDAQPGGLILWPEGAYVLGIFLGGIFHFWVHLVLAVIGACALWWTTTARYYAQLIFYVCAILVVIGILEPEGFWFAPVNWSRDVAHGQIVTTIHPSWYGLVPLNWADTALNGLVAIAGLVFGFTPFGVRRWGYWRRPAAPAPAGSTGAAGGGATG